MRASPTVTQDKIIMWMLNGRKKFSSHSFDSILCAVMQLCFCVDGCLGFGVYVFTCTFKHVEKCLISYTCIWPPSETPPMINTGQSIKLVKHNEYTNNGTHKHTLKIIPPVPHGSLSMWPCARERSSLTLQLSTSHIHVHVHVHTHTHTQLKRTSIVSSFVQVHSHTDTHIYVPQYQVQMLSPVKTNKGNTPTSTWSRGFPFFSLSLCAKNTLLSVLFVFLGERTSVHSVRTLWCVVFMSISTLCLCWGLSAPHVSELTEHNNSFIL